MTRFMICAALFLGAPAFADDYRNIVETALSRISNEYHLDWAFTETKVEDGVTTVGHYDPRNSGDDRWTLVSVDGRAPTGEEIEGYQEDRHDDFEDEDDGSDFDMVNLDTIRLVDETDELWIFEFVPTIDEDEDEEGRKFMEKVSGQLSIDRANTDLRYLKLFNEKPIRPAFSVKISHFMTQLEFGQAASGGPIVPLSINVEIKGRAFLAIGIDETQSVRYTDYEFVSD